jgi:hypothetical protein
MLAVKDKVVVVDGGWGGGGSMARARLLSFVDILHCFVNKKHQLRRKDRRKTLWIDFVSNVIEIDP